MKICTSRKANAAYIMTMYTIITTNIKHMVTIYTAKITIIAANITSSMTKYQTKIIITRNTTAMYNCNFMNLNLYSLC
jgi:hypothetical protein